MQKLISLKLPFIALILFIQSCTAIPKSNTNELDLPNLIPYRSGKLWGYSDKNKSIIIKCKYDDVTFFNEYGLAQVFKKNPNFEESFKHPYFVGVIDTLGNEIIPLGIYRSFKQIIYDGGNKFKYGPFDAVVYGDIQILKIKESFKYFSGDYDESISGFKPKELNYNSNIILLHEKYDVGTAYNRNGDIILTDSFTILGSPKRLISAEYYFAAQHKTQKYFQVFNKDGELVLNKKFKEVNSINDSLYVGVDFEGGKSGLYHYSGKILFEEQRFIYSLFDYHTGEIGLISVITSNEEELYSLKFNKFIAPPTNYGKFASGRSPNSHINIFYHNSKLLINYGKDRSEYGLFSNETGEMIVKGYKQMEVDYSFELIMAKNNNTIHLYDFDAKKLNEFLDVDTVIPISQKHFLVTRNSKAGIWSQQTKTYIVDIAFENIDFSLPDVFLAQTVDNKITVFDSLGKMVFPQKFDKHSIFIEDDVDGCWSYFRNVHNEEVFNIVPVRVYSGSATSFQYSFAQEEYDIFLRHKSIRNFYNKDYDRILRELKKELITVVLEDSLGNRYRLMPDYKLKSLPNDADLVYRIMDVYFYGKGKSKLAFYIDGKDTKHNAYSMEVKYYLNQPFVIIGIGNSLFPDEFYAFDPVINSRSEINFEYLDFKFLNDSMYYYGLSGNFYYLLSSEFKTNLKTGKNQKLAFKTNDYRVIIEGLSENLDYKGGYGALSMVNKNGQILFKNYCKINPTIYNHLIALSYCTENENVFVGYCNINGTKYFD